ncbi:MAG: hypothetical protein IT558_00540 [Alphaproteobacteria bacterium]|nr:hypothetical protein [Alphaproteobacteria bacterium]
MNQDEKNKIRLGDRIQSALELAVAQEDLAISEMLVRALEMTMTRKTGGAGFIERRDYPPELDAIMEKLYTMRDKAKA